LPDDFVVPDAWIEDATAERINHNRPPIRDLQLEATKFVNRNVAKGTTMVNWRRAFLNWCLSPYIDQDQDTGRPAGNRKSKRGALVNTALAFATGGYR
jgi:hypothetical protein